ncbi:MAG: MFS transporter [Bacteroidota bacterium]
MAAPATMSPASETISSKPRLSFWQIWNMSFGFLGIQFGFALQNANVSRIFETLGADIDQIPILWIAAPITGLVVQPIIGHMSDKTWNRLGRRRPYFLVGAILASSALLIMPYSPGLWVAAGMLWIMDGSINVSMEPFRAFVGDMLPSDQRTAGFAMQSFFIGLGAVVASALPYMMTNWFGISNTAPEGIVPPSVQFSFIIGAIVFLASVLWTVFTTKEYSPEEMQRFQAEEAQQKAAATTVSEDNLPAATFLKYAYVWIGLGGGLFALIGNQGWDKELYILAFMVLGYGLLQLFTGQLTKAGRTDNGFVEVVNDLFKMPKTMGQLAIVQFFSWFALFSMWIYTTSAVTSYIYGTSDTTSKLYNDGADWVTVLFAIYNGIAALVAFGLPIWAKKTSRKKVHMYSLIAGGLGLLSIYFIKEPSLLWVSMLGIGLAWASILSMPYAILTGALPVHKLGIYMGIFNFFIVIPQITAASILGFMVRNLFGGETIYALVTGGISLILAALLVTRVDDVDEGA